MRKSLLRPEPVGEMAEAERADDRAGEIGAGGEADLGVASSAELRVAGDRAGSEPTSVTSSPSRTQVMPSAMTISQ